MRKNTVDEKMETKLHTIKNIKDAEKTKAAVLEKVRVMISPNATLGADTITVVKKTTWASLTCTMNFKKVGSDLELITTTESKATDNAMLLGCLTVFFFWPAALLIWYVYDQDRNSFNSAVASIISYAIEQ